MTFLISVTKQPIPKVKGGKPIQLTATEVSVHSGWPRGDMAEGHHWVGTVLQRQKTAEQCRAKAVRNDQAQQSSACPFSLTQGAGPQGGACSHQGGSAHRQGGLPILHTRNSAKSTSGLIYNCTPSLLASHSLDPVTSEKPHYSHLTIFFISKWSL